MNRFLEKIKSRCAGLAPMAGVADGAFRELCMEGGAAFCVSEMISAKALTFSDKKTAALMRFSEAERPFGIQLFGSEPDTMAAAARLVAPLRPDFIDINMGCPAPKITSGGSGSALLKDPALAASIVEAAANAVGIPVTVKLRAGYDETNAPDIAPLLEKAGARALTVHGRTRERMYAPPVDLDVIRDVKARVSIPVIGNGDILCAADALRMLDYTGCDAVMVGRGALGNPFVFSEINAALSGKGAPAPADAKARMDALRRHAERACELKGERVAMLEIRKHAAWYAKGFRGAAALRKSACELSSLADLEQFTEAALAENS